MEYPKTIPFSFFIVIPMGGLVMGLPVWKSRSIAARMTAYGFLNAFGQFGMFHHFYRCKTACKQRLRA
jgi:hypothetical protein